LNVTLLDFPEDWLGFSLNAFKVQCRKTLNGL